jgi:hypothetical protein
MVWIRRQVLDCRKTGFGNIVRQLIASNLCLCYGESLVKKWHFFVKVGQLLRCVRIGYWGKVHVNY